MIMNLSKIEEYWMLINFPFVSLSMSYIFGIDVAIVTSLVLCINFVKIHTDSEIVLFMT